MTLGCFLSKYTLNGILKGSLQEVGPEREIGIQWKVTVNLEQDGKPAAALHVVSAIRIVPGKEKTRNPSRF